MRSCLAPCPVKLIWLDCSAVLREVIVDGASRWARPQPISEATMRPPVREVEEPSAVSPRIRPTLVSRSQIRALSDPQGKTTRAVLRVSASPSTGGRGIRHEEDTIKENRHSAPFGMPFVKNSRTARASSVQIQSPVFGLNYVLDRGSELAQRLLKLPRTICNTAKFDTGSWTLERSVRFTDSPAITKRTEYARSLATRCIPL